MIRRNTEHVFHHLKAVCLLDLDLIYFKSAIKNFDQAGTKHDSCSFLAITKKIVLHPIHTSKKIKPSAKLSSAQIGFNQFDLEGTTELKRW
jgi:hypothetical protein